MTRKPLLLLGAKLVFSGLLLWWVLTKVDFADVVARLRVARFSWLLPPLLLGPVVVLLSAWRWHILSLGLIGFGQATRYTWIGLFFGSVLPGAIGGDVAKGVSLAASSSSARDSRLPVSILMDKLIGFWVLLLQFTAAALTMLVLQPGLLQGLRSALWIAVLAMTAGLVGAIAICHPRGAAAFTALGARLPGAPLRNVAARVLGAFGAYSNQGRALASAAAISFTIHFLNACSFWLVLRSLAIPATIGFAAVFYPLLSTLLTLPVSVSGVGVRDVFAASMFTAFGLNPESGVAYSWLLLGLSIPNVLIGGGIQLRELFRRVAS